MNSSELKNINDIVRQLSEEMEVNFDEVGENTLHQGTYLKAAVVYHENEKYGVVAFTSDDEGLKFCMYEGKYPKRNNINSSPGEVLDKIRLVVERDRYSDNLYRLDSFGSICNGSIVFLECLEYIDVKKTLELYSEAESLCHDLSVK